MAKELDDFHFEKLELILENISIGVLKTDDKGNILFANKACKNILSLTKRRSEKCNIRDILSKTSFTDTISSNKKCHKSSILLNGKSIEITEFPVKNSLGNLEVIFVINDETNHINMKKDLKHSKELLEVLETVLEMTYDGIVVVDKDGYIKMISKVYADFIGVDKEEVVDKHVTEVIENTRIHIVAKTGIRESVVFQKLRGRYIIANRIPIIKDGEIYGAVGKILFRNLKSFNAFSSKINKIQKEIKQYKAGVSDGNSAIYTFENIIGVSDEIEKTKNIGKKAAMTTSNVLLMGESGTGKELFAHAIHKSSDRAYGNFIRVNCAAIPSELLESELFGYEKGSFTGANREGKIGKFELADNGTIFLDEIGDMPLSMQVKLLRTIQEKEVERIGSGVTKKIDVRIIAATNRDLKKMVEEKKFRQDLYYRLNVVTIKVPPLRERKEDIQILICFLLEKLSRKINKKIKGITKEAIEYMKNYTWEGNVRQLENVIEMAMNIVNYGEKIGIEHLPKEITGRKILCGTQKLEDIVNQAEKDAILNTLIMCKGNKSKAAKLLQISRTTLYEKMNKHNIAE